MSIESIFSPIMKYAIYEPSTGKIVRTLTCPDLIIEEQMEDSEYGYLPIYDEEGFDARDWYVVDGELEEKETIVLNFSKKTINSAIEGDSLTINDLPVPLTININGDDYEIEDDGLEIESSVKGIYKIRIDKFPYKLYEDEYTVT